MTDDALATKKSVRLAIGAHIEGVVPLENMTQ